MKDVLHTSNALALWQNRDYWIASAARFLATVGYGAVTVTIMLHIQSTASDSASGAWLVTCYLLLATLPTVLLAPWAGRLADTRDSRTLATLASLLSAMAVALMALSTILLDNYLPALLTLTVVLEAGLAIASPTWQALLPRIVGEERTPRAMGTMQATLMLAGMVGPALGGLLLGQGGLTFSFWVAAIGYLILAAGAFAIRTRRSLHTEASTAGLEQQKPRLLDGLRTLRKDSFLTLVVGATLLIVLFGEAINVLEVFLARDELHATEWQYGLLSATMSIGLVIGSLWAGRINSEKLRLHIFLASAMVAAAILALMGLANSLLWLFVLAALVGVCIGALNATFGAILMLRTAEHQRGQVSSIVQALTRAVSIGALGLGGVLGGLLGPRMGFVLSGVLTLVLCAGASVVILRFSRHQKPVEEQLLNLVE